MDRKRSPLKPGLDSDLDLRIGRLEQNKTEPRNKHTNRRRRLKSRLDLNAMILVRQTASIFKQPVSMVTNHPSNKVKTDQRRDLDQPKQLFWNRKLFGLSALDAVDQSVQMNLPAVFHSVAPSYSEQSLLAAIAGTLHSGPAPSSQLTLTGSFGVTDNDIRRQEVLVQGVRRRLEAVLMVHMAANTEKTTADGSEQNHQRQVDLMQH
ncbi:methyl-CpG-binding domain protein 3-like isoform X2 [Sphaeramia orbicularis]|uniref:methyl-CpG-binding domain protein 3-like isoform X2 n=1 Tax=Sphaeramia orbicularis TaxID=375764 RepID=UPI00117EAD0A|nr:methyl-CpG-binding domain protein 3-like isoform X2 [Sphaeramia orbicularis]